MSINFNSDTLLNEFDCKSKLSNSELEENLSNIEQYNLGSNSTNNSRDNIDVFPQNTNNIRSSFEECNRIFNNSYNFNLISDEEEDNSKKDIYFKKASLYDIDTVNKRPPLLNQKHKRTEEEKIQDKKTDYSSGIKKQKCGRKTAKEIIVVHDKFKGDNIIRRIKVHVIQEKIIKLINKYFKSKKLKHKKLCKLYQRDVTCLKKDKNLKFMNSTLKDIYTEHKIGTKYNNNKANNNKKLIDEIYNKNEYIDLQKLLNLTYLEFFEIYTHEITKTELSEELNKKKQDIKLFNSSTFKGIEEFVGELYKKEKKKMLDEEIKEYINEFKKYCGCYKEWFENKKGRNEEKIE